ncbi:TIM barrel protein [Candidatus Uabimicrobium amorphum]|uniref:Xylose isomerase-like TIM barrel domain-containing protein n=1 Tax=Uabimicrobium amorphum TaxID=2596890 RepID=A0A5S9F807_UABAM|nr:TIM barrel protein [Candidatus Uabimicrobium amorphum]BBM88299.1 hypothetical protein UABAM_06720 [Candidatus Uabimicrobium amorphum]
MIAISSAGCTSSAAEYTQHLYREGLFKDFEFMVEDHIVLKDLMNIVSLNMQPELVKSCAGYSLCSNAENDRQNYLANVANVASKAVHYKCKNVIVWPGYVPVVNGFEKHNRALNNGEEFECPKRTMYLQNLCRSLYTLCKKFPDINFCIPTGRTFYEIPTSVEEVQWILEDVNAPNLKYWHNTAHSHLLEKMKHEAQDNWLQSLGDRTWGVHLEDVVGVEALCPPGTGEVKFHHIKSHLPKNALKVLRISEQFGAFGIQTALDMIRF